MSLLSRLPVAHRIWRLLPASVRRMAMVHISAMLAPRPDAYPPTTSEGIAICGELSRSTGLGEGARLMHAALERLHIPCWPIDISGTLPGTTEQASPSPNPTPPSSALLMMHVNAPMLPFVFLKLPRSLIPGRRVIANWVWELSIPHPLWRPGVRFVHEIWVPSQFTYESINQIAPGRVRVVPYPLALVPPVPSSRRRADFGLPEAAVVVLTSINLASSFVRKNPLGAIAAFRAAFSNRKDRHMLLKVNNSDNFPDDLEQLRAATAEIPNIQLWTEELSAADNHALTAAADVVLSLHRSEGFGLVPAEAMLLGRAVVATGWSGNMQFMDNDTAALTGYKLVPARDPRRVFEVPGAVWAEPNMADAVTQLRRLADDATARAEIGRRAREAVSARLGGDELVRALRDLGFLVAADPHIDGLAPKF
jgi:glycosyltransferase involved in cell wall biosynthesis